MRHLSSSPPQAVNLDGRFTWASGLGFEVHGVEAFALDVVQ